jgi:hypothetical protein
MLSATLLQSGAVVATIVETRSDKGRTFVSIPFSAGQWSRQISRGVVGKTADRSQSPSVRGSGRDYFIGRPVLIDTCVSIPFSAGQWSRRWTLVVAVAVHTGLNPLQCGAVVATDWCNGVGLASICLNPLQCGAVVAT